MDYHRWAGLFSLSGQWHPPGNPLVQQLMLLGSRAVQAPFGLSTQLGSWILQSWPRSAALSLTVPCEKLTAWLSGSRQGHEKLGKVVLGQVPEGFASDPVLVHLK